MNFEILTVVTMNSSVLQNVTPWILVENYQRFLASVSPLGYPKALYSKTEAAGSSDTAVHVY